MTHANRPLARLRLIDLTDTQIGALLAAYNRRLTLKYRPGLAAMWMPEGLDAMIERATFSRLCTLDLMRLDGKVGRLTPKGFALAELAVTLSRQIAAGVIGLDTRGVLPVIAEPIEAAPALRLSTHPKPRDVIGAQLARSRKVNA